MRTSSWEKDKDIIAGTESFDDDFGSAYDRVAYDVPNKGNAAGIKLPKRASEMTIGELEDFYGTANNPTEARLRSQAYGAKRFGSDSPQGKYGSSGTGKYQFEVTTLSQTAKDLYGDNYRNVVYSPDEQEKLAKHLYSKKAAEGPEALGNTWFAMKNKTSAGPSADAYDSPSSTSSSDPTSRVTDTWSKTNSAISGEIERASKVVGPVLSATSALVVPAAATALLNKFKKDNPDQNDKSDDREQDPIQSGTIARFAAPKAAINKKVILRRKTERSKTPIRFKDFRKNIYEQIIMNESLDKEDK